MSRPGTADSDIDEKASATFKRKSKLGFLSRHRSVKATNDANSEKNLEAIITEVKAAEPDVPPVSFTSLFRYVGIDPSVSGCLLINPQFFNEARIVHGLHWLNRCSCSRRSTGIFTPI